MSNTLLLATTVAGEVLHNKSIQTDSLRALKTCKETATGSNVKIFSSDSPTPLATYFASFLYQNTSCLMQTGNDADSEKGWKELTVLHTKKTAQCNFQCVGWIANGILGRNGANSRALVSVSLILLLIDSLTACCFDTEVQPSHWKFKEFDASWSKEQ